jgi:hypothetical protein
MIRRTILIQATICAMFLGACGDDGDDNGPMPIDVALQVGGIWNGTAFADIFQPDAPGTPLRLEDAEIIFFTTEADPDTGVSQFRLVSNFALQATGEITVTEGITNQEDDTLTGTFTAFAPDGYVFSDGLRTAACETTGEFMETIAADFTETKTIFATYTCKDKDQSIVATGEFQGDYDADRYEQPSSFNRVAGTWSGLDFSTTNNDVELVLEVLQEDGAVNGENDIGCFYAGQIDIIDPAFNLYGISLTVSNCLLVNGIYAGLATLTPGMDGTPDEFIYQVDNGTIILTQPVFQFKTPTP